MSKDIEVRDEHNTIIGWCRDNGSDVNGIHIKKGYVGRYNKSSNITFDSKGKIYCYGDGVQSLVRDANK